MLGYSGYHAECAVVSPWVRDLTQMNPHALYAKIKTEIRWFPGYGFFLQASYVSSPVPLWSSWETFHAYFHLSFSLCWQEWDMGMRSVRDTSLQHLYSMCELQMCTHDFGFQVGGANHPPESNRVIWRQQQSQPFALINAHFSLILGDWCNTFLAAFCSQLHCTVTVTLQKWILICGILSHATRSLISRLLSTM